MLPLAVASIFSVGVSCNPSRRAYLSDADRAPLAIDGDRDVGPHEV